MVIGESARCHSCKAIPLEKDSVLETPPRGKKGQLTSQEFFPHTSWSLDSLYSEFYTELYLFVLQCIILPPSAPTWTVAPNSFLMPSLFFLCFFFFTFSSVQFSSVHLLSCVQLFATPWTAAQQASLSISNPWNLPKLMSIESVMPSNHLIICYPLLLLPSIFSSIRDFSNESVLRIRWPKYWSFSFNISPSNEHSGLISFRMDWLDLLAVQGTLQSLLQHHSSKASILRCSAFFLVQPLHQYMTTGKTIALTRQTFVAKVMSLLFIP